MQLSKKNWLQIVTLLISAVLVFLIIAKINSYRHYKHKQPEAVIKSKPLMINDRDIFFGNSDAPIDIYIFYNYSCAACVKFFKETYPKLYKHYIEKGEVKLILKPVNLMDNPKINQALETVYSLNQVGQLEAIHQLFIENNSIIYSQEFEVFVNKMIQNNSEIEHCLSMHTYLSQIEDNNSTLKAYNITVTPTFIIGKTIYKGYIDYKLLKLIIKKQVKSGL